jgi:acetolactate synthase-1/2/3 large subunit
MTGGELIVKLLKLHGINHIFGTPGDQVKSIYDALRSSQKIEYFSAQTSQAATFMADGYARATGNVGVCITPGGHSAVNAAVSLAAAYADSIPLLLITGQVPLHGLLSEEIKDKLKEDSEYVDLFNLFKPIAKWNTRIDSLAGLTEATARAFKALQTGRPRPVHLEIPADILKGELAEPVAVKATPIRRMPGVSPPLNALTAELLVQAKSPLIVAGGGVVSAKAGAELIQIAERLNAPICTTPMSKGVIPSDHLLSAGLTWQAPTPGADVHCQILPLIKEADVVLSVGCSLSQRTAGNWNTRLLPNLIQIDIDEKEIGRNFPVRIGIVADAKVALAHLIQAIDNGAGTVRSQWNDFRSELQPSTYRDGYDLKVMQILRNTLEDRAIISVGGVHLIDTMLMNFEVAHPRLFLHACDLRPMGYALPAALGAKCAHPDCQVVTVTDTEEFSMTGRELITANQYGLGLPVIVINNREPSEKPDSVKFAESFGVPGFHVRKIDQFAPALKDALTAKECTVIEVQLS